MTAPDPQEAARHAVSEEEQVRVDLEHTRAELAETVDALTNKLNVKARATDQVDQAKQRVAATVTRAKQSVPPQVQHAIDVATEKAKPHASKIAAGAAAALVVVLILRRRRGN